MPKEPRLRAAVLVGIAVAATILAFATVGRPSSPVTPAEANEAITAIRSGLEPAAVPAKPLAGLRISARHHGGNGPDQVVLAALAMMLVLALGQVVMGDQRWQGPRRPVHRAWTERAPPFFQLT